jgi:hypothetical protein
MSRPLLVTDCDEVLLHMVVPFAQWADEIHAMHFDLDSEDFTYSLRHKKCGTPVEREQIWPLLQAFFRTEMHRQLPTSGAVAAMAEIATVADIVVLTNISADEQQGRVDQLRAIGLNAPVHCNSGPKGEPLAKIVADYAPTVAVFVDDLGMHHDSAAEHVPDVWRLHMVGEPRLTAKIPTARTAHARIDDWDTAKNWILARFEGVALEAA